MDRLKQPQPGHSHRDLRRPGYSQMRQNQMKRVWFDKLRIVGIVVLLMSISSRMFGSLLLCCWSFSLLPLSSSLVHGNLQLEEGPAAGHRPEGPYLSDLERGHAPNAMRDPSLLPVDSVEDPFLMDAGSYDEDSSAALQLQDRAMRSPRRCIPHQQSCLGYPLPCCDSCDTCYCRFFNAFCYCRRVGHTCPARHT